MRKERWRSQSASGTMKPRPSVWVALSFTALLVAVVSAGALPAPAAGPSRGLVQLKGKLGCVHKGGTTGCARGRGIAGPTQVALSPDGRHAYVAGFNSNAIAVFVRNRSGALRQLPGERGCISHKGAGPCAFGRALAAPVSIAVSPDGRNVYTAAAGSDALAVFARNARTGVLRQLPGASGCVGHLAGGGCTNGRALNEPVAVIASGDGKRIYVASREDPSAVAVFVRGRGGGLTQPAGQAGCVSENDASGCTVVRGLRNAFDVAASPDGSSVYAVGSNSDSVAVFRRTAGGLIQPNGAGGCLAATAAEGCTVARALGEPAGVEVSLDGRGVYVASYGSDAVATLRRNPSTGTLVQAAGRSGCISQAGGGGCATGRGLDGPEDVAVSPDGRSAYVVSAKVSSMSVLARNRSSGALTQVPGKGGCHIPGGILGCSNARGLADAVDVAVSGTGRYVYLASANDERGTVGIFRRLGR